MTAEALLSKRTDAVVQRSSTMLIMEEKKALRNLGYAQPAELNGCLKILLRVPKTGSAVNIDEISGFQQESTEEIAVLLLRQRGETELFTNN
ncbi:meiosis-specific kinetochore protein [Grus japonensis]|uniref:Meiosis-specific kinetochore protein n=1 Tax=Grus japonensis TaxID=30415 RepID=A0ABC9XDX3_GRUJA